MKCSVWHVVAFLFLGLVDPAVGQVVDERWSRVQQLSTPGAVVRSDPAMVAGETGLHAFWVEREESGDAILYSRFTERVWMSPTVIFAARRGRSIGSLSVARRDGNLDLVWAEEPAGPVYISSVAEPKAAQLREWSRPSGSDISALEVWLAVDESGARHLLYTDVHGEAPGVFYRRSTDGTRWGVSSRLDNTPHDHRAFFLRLALDSRQGMHATWTEVEQTSGRYRGQHVVYTRSIDKGETWEAAKRIDSAVDPEDRVARPSIASRGDEVHLVWQTPDLGRRHSVSTNRGEDWQDGLLDVGNLHGQARGDALIFDRAGRLHLLAQIRWPMAIFQVVRESEVWGSPSEVYRIKERDTTPLESRIEAHNVRAAVSAGGRIVLLFQDAKRREARLFALHTTESGF